MKQESSFLNSTNKFLQILILVFLISCNNETELEQSMNCEYDNFKGEYLLFSDTDTSSSKIEIEFLEENVFQTKGIGGYGFWFPSASLSGEINDCQIKLDSYKDVEREGLPSPGGAPRYYYESMSGFGEYFAQSDSIRLSITYERTGDFVEYFNGDIYLLRVE